MAVEEEEEEEEKETVHGIESFLKGLSPSTLEYKLGVEINQMLKKYRMRKARIEERKREVNSNFKKINHEIIRKRK